MKENSIHVESLLYNYKRKKVWLECKVCEALFEASSKKRLRCPTCWIANKKQLSLTRIKVVKEKARIKKNPKLKPTKKRCVGCKKEFPYGRASYCSKECRIRTTTGYASNPQLGID